MSKELLFEIGTEEIPAAFLTKAIIDIEEMAKKTFTEKRIPYAGIRALATPRRLCLYIAELAEKQEDQTTEKLGPAKKAAFDEKGNPSKAALGFARGQGLEISQLETIRVFTIAAVGGTPGRLDVGHVPWLRSECAQAGRRMKRSRSDFDVVRLLNYASLRMPILFQGEDQFLKSHNFLLAGQPKDQPIYTLFPYIRLSLLIQVAGFLNLILRCRLFDFPLPAA